MSQLKIFLLVKFWTHRNSIMAAMAYFSCFEGVLGIKRLFFKIHSLNCSQIWLHQLKIYHHAKFWTLLKPPWLFPAVFGWFEGSNGHFKKLTHFFVAKTVVSWETTSIAHFGFRLKSYCKHCLDNQCRDICWLLPTTAFQTYWNPTHLSVFGCFGGQMTRYSRGTLYFSWKSTFVKSRTQWNHTLMGVLDIKWPFLVADTHWSVCRQSIHQSL